MLDDISYKRYGHGAVTKYTIVPVDTLQLAPNPSNVRFMGPRFIALNNKIFCVVSSTMNDGAKFKLLEVSRLAPPENFNPDITWEDNGVYYLGEFQQFVAMGKEIYIVAKIPTGYATVNMKKVNAIKDAW